MKKHAIVLAAGSGTRMTGYQTIKALIPLDNKPLFLYSLLSFDNNKDIDDLILIVHKDYKDEFIKFTKCIKKPLHIIEGGSTRFESVKNGLDYLKINSSKDDIVLIHDSARPFIKDEFISLLVKECKNKPAIMSVLPSKDTIAISEDQKTISSIPNRKNMFIELTPSAYKLEIILNAYKKAIEDGIKDSTDDCSLIKNAKYPLYFLIGNDISFKITYPIDIKIAESLLQNL